MRDADVLSFEVKAAQSRSLHHPDSGEADAASAVDVDRLPANPRTVRRRKRAASEKEAIMSCLFVLLEVVRLMERVSFSFLMIIRLSIDQLPGRWLFSSRWQMADGRLQMADGRQKGNAAYKIWTH